MFYTLFQTTGKNVKAPIVIKFYNSQRDAELYCQRDLLEMNDKTRLTLPNGDPIFRWNRAPNTPQIFHCPQNEQTISVLIAETEQDVINRLTNQTKAPEI